MGLFVGLEWFMVNSIKDHVLPVRERCRRMEMLSFDRLGGRFVRLKLKPWLRFRVKDLGLTRE